MRCARKEGGRREDQITKKGPGVVLMLVFEGEG